MLFRSNDAAYVSGSFVSNNFLVASGTNGSTSGSVTGLTSIALFGNTGRLTGQVAYASGYITNDAAQLTIGTLPYGRLTTQTTAVVSGNILSIDGNSNRLWVAPSTLSVGTATFASFANVQTQTGGVNAVNSGTLNFLGGTGITRSITNNGGKADLLASINPAVVVTNGGIVLNGIPLANGTNTSLSGGSTNGTFTLYATAGLLRGTTTAYRSIPFGERVALTGTTSFVEWPQRVMPRTFTNSDVRVWISGIATPTGTGTSIVELAYGDFQGTTNIPITYYATTNITVVSAQTNAVFSPVNIFSNAAPNRLYNLRAAYISGDSNQLIGVTIYHAATP